MSCKYQNFFQILFSLPLAFWTKIHFDFDKLRHGDTLPHFPPFSPSRPTVTPSRTMPGTTGLAGVVPAGVLTGENVIKLFQHCSDNGVALPAFNCTSSSTINAVLQVRRD